jgi:hypothetical protein
LIGLLRQHLERNRDDFVFTTPEGNWHRRSNFSRRAIRPAADGRELFATDGTAYREDPIRRGLTFHGLRHSHKTWMIADGIPEVAQSRRLGHVLHDKIQETYSHVAPEVEARLLLAMEDRWSKAVANSHRDPQDAPYRDVTTPNDRACASSPPAPEVVEPFWDQTDRRQKQALGSWSSHEGNAA